MTLMRKGHTMSYQQPGDILVSDDERALYIVAKDGSNRRLKDRGLICETLHRFREMKREAETARAAEKAPITGVSQKTLNTVAAMLAIGGPLPQLPRLQ